MVTVFFWRDSYGYEHLEIWKGEQYFCTQVRYKKWGKTSLYQVWEYARNKILQETGKKKLPNIKNQKSCWSVKLTEEELDKLTKNASPNSYLARVRKKMLE